MQAAENMATLFKSVALVPAASIINGHVGYWGAAALHTTRARWRSLAAKAGVGSRRCWGMRRRRTPLKRAGMSGEGEMALGHRATSPRRAGLTARLGRERPLQAACLRSRQSRVTPHYLPRQCRLRVPGNMATLFKSAALVPAASIINGHVAHWGAAALHTTRAPWRSLAAKAGVGSRCCWGMRRRRTPLKRGGMSGEGGWRRGTGQPALKGLA